MRTVITLYRKKVHPGTLFNKTPDRCRSCKVKFKKSPFKVIWKDCVECIHCGYIWVLDDIHDIFKYSE